jgi:hypothetical protein
MSVLIGYIWGAVGSSITLQSAQMETETNMVCVLGVASVKGAVELYAVNTSREVTMHGWFDRNAGFALLSDRPPCLIAVDADCISSDMIAALRLMGHAVVVMPTTGKSNRSKFRRSAKDVCQLAMGFAGSISRSPAMLQ